MAKKRNSTSAESPREEIVGERFLPEADGTGLGASCENTSGITVCITGSVVGVLKRGVWPALTAKERAAGAGS